MPLHWRVYVPSRGGNREVIIERPVSVNNRDYMETAGCLMWDGDRYSWQLPEEAYMATMLTSTEVGQILALLHWINVWGRS